MRRTSISMTFGFIIVLLVFSAVVSFFPSLNKYALYGALPLAFVLSFTEVTENNLRNVLHNKYIVWFIVLYIWISFTSIYAEYQAEARQQLHEILGVVLLMAVIVINGNKKENYPWLYAVYFFFYVGMMYYAQSNILTKIVIGSERLDDDQLNANTVAYYTFYLTYAFFILAECVKSVFYFKLYRFLFLLTIPLSLIIAFLTASRQVLIIQVPLIAILLYSRYMVNSKRSKFWFVALAIIAVIAVSGYVQDMYEGSYLQERNEYDLEDDPRPLLMQDAIKVGFEHFFTGVGAGNYVRYSYNAHFSHCTYTELFANTGILGAIIYIVIVSRLFIVQWKRYRSTKDKMYLYFATFFFIFIIDNLFYVFYNSIWLMGFFAIVMMNSSLYYKEHNSSRFIDS